MCLCHIVSSRCLMLPPVPCVAPSNCSVSSTLPGRSPSVLTLTAASALLSGACAGIVEDPVLVVGAHFFLSICVCSLRLSMAVSVSISVCTQATSRSWSPLWSWRAMHPCGLLQSVSTKYESPSARTQSWRCAPKAWVHRQKHCGSVYRSSC